MEEAGCTAGASVTACSLFPQHPALLLPLFALRPPPTSRFGTALLASHCRLISRTAALDNGESDIPWTGLSEAARTPTILAADAQKASPGYCQGGRLAWENTRDTKTGTGIQTVTHTLKPCQHTQHARAVPVK